MPGHSLLILGPSGAGKSTTAAGALEAEGSGFVFMAPGDDEISSYVQFMGKENYKLQGFDDPEFLPLIGDRKTSGLANAMQFAKALHAKLQQEYAEQKPLSYKVIVIDKISGFGELAVNVMLKECNLKEAPPAQSPEGARYYVGITNLLHQLIRPLRACRGYGAHLIITSHVSEKEVSNTAMAEASGEAQVALIPGRAFREALPGIVDFSFYAGVNKMGKVVDGHNDPTNPRHYLQWMADPKKPTKSRLGRLSDQKLLPNEWSYLKPLLDAALARRVNREAA
jgi:AAA domain-containing protein